MSAGTAAGTAAGSAAGEGVSWRRRIKHLVSSQLRQVPCLHAVMPALSCCKNRSRKYQTLGQDEDEDSGALEDDRQRINKTFGVVMIRGAMLVAVAITIKMVVQNRKWRYEYSDADAASPDPAESIEEFTKESFHRDSPIVLYMAVVEILACGACATTAASMYRRRRHQLQHPADSNDKIKASYIKVDLEKECGSEDKQSYGLGFRPSSDGLECLVVETVRWGSLLDQWNRRRLAPSPEELMEEALGDEEMLEVGANGNAPAPSPTDTADASGDGSTTTTAEELRRDFLRRRTVEPGCAIVAVNDVAGDVGMMQLQLLKPKVTMWVRQEFQHASQFQDGLFARDMEFAAAQQGHSAGGDSSAMASGATPANGSGQQDAASQHSSIAPPAVQAVQFGAGDGGMSNFVREIGFALGLPQLSKGPRCVCVGLEDEEPQILNRWLACSMIFGWVTMLPVLLMQPHEERPRQQLFRQFLLKPCILILPIWLLFWFLDCIQVALELPIVTPIAFFGIVHMVLPAVLVWYLLQMQAADEELVLEQRASRHKEVRAGTALPLAVEDPVPTFLKELVMINPVALVWLGSCISVPLVATSFLTPLKTERGQLAQGSVNLIYSPLIPLQLGFAFVLWHLKFEQVPKLYLTGFGLLLSLPCFIIWCFCIICSSRYGRKDLELVRQQRLDRGKALKASLEASTSEQAQDIADAEETSRAPSRNVELPTDIVDCSEAQCREWELIYTV